MEVQCTPALVEVHCTPLPSEAAWQWPAGHFCQGPAVRRLSCGSGHVSGSPPWACWLWPCCWNLCSKVVWPFYSGSALACSDTTAITTRYGALFSCSPQQDWAQFKSLPGQPSPLMKAQLPSHTPALAQGFETQVRAAG